MCNGLGNLDGNEGVNTGGGDDDVGVMAAMKKGMTKWTLPWLYARWWRWWGWCVQQQCKVATATGYTMDGAPQKVA